MKLFIVKRFVLFLITIWLVVTFTFVLIKCLPGDPFVSDKAIHPQILNNLKAKYGMDKPVFTQYVIYLKNLTKGDLGISMQYRNRSVVSIIKRTFPVSLNLGIRALAIAVLMGGLLGVAAAFYRNKALDYTALTVAVIGVSVPGFILGTLFQYFICFKLSAFIQYLTGIEYNIFPVTGWGSFRYTVIPSVVLAFGALGMIIRMMRASMVDVLSQNYIVSARAKGLSGKEIVSRHALKNAILPVLSVLGPLMTSIIMGSFVIENIFSIPGLGKYFVSSIKDKDYTMAIGLALFTAFIVVLVNTLTDILYTFIDPRVRLGSGETDLSSRI